MIQDWKPKQKCKKKIFIFYVWWTRKKSKIIENVMLNLIQHLTKSTTYETLKSLDPEASSGPGSGWQIGIFYENIMCKNSIKRL